jgi:hypothetical protein
MALTTHPHHFPLTLTTLLSLLPLTTHYFLRSDPNIRKNLSNYVRSLTHFKLSSNGRSENNKDLTTPSVTSTKKKSSNSGVSSSSKASSDSQGSSDESVDGDVHASRVSKKGGKKMKKDRDVTKSLVQRSKESMDAVRSALHLKGGFKGGRWVEGIDRSAGRAWKNKALYCRCPMIR